MCMCTGRPESTECVWTLVCAVAVDFCMSVFSLSVFFFLYVHTYICLHPHMCACTRVCFSMCVFTAGRGSICVRLTRWESLPAGSPLGPKSSGRPEAWNPSRPGQMSPCSAWLRLQRPHRPVKTLGAEFDSSKNVDQIMARPDWMTSEPKHSKPPKKTPKNFIISRGKLKMICFIKSNSVNTVQN